MATRMRFTKKITIDVVRPCLTGQITVVLHTALEILTNRLIGPDAETPKTYFSHSRCMCTQAQTVESFECGFNRTQNKAIVMPITKENEKTKSACNSVCTI